MKKTDSEMVSEGLTHLAIVQIASHYGFKDVLCVKYDNTADVYVLTLPNRLRFTLAKECVDTYKERM